MELCLFWHNSQEESLLREALLVVPEGFVTREDGGRFRRHLQSYAKPDPMGSFFSSSARVASWPFRVLGSFEAPIAISTPWLRT